MTRVVIHREPIDPGEIVRDEKQAREWKKRWSVCWLLPTVYHRRFHKHHIVGGAHRSDELCNLCFLSETAHAFVESMSDLEGVRLCLLLKKHFDPENYDKRRVEQLYGRRVDQ